MRTTVECYAGAGYPERPRAIVIDGAPVQVAEVEDRGRTPDGLRFRVRVSNGARFLLLYDEIEDSWELRRLDNSVPGFPGRPAFLPRR